MNDEDKVCGGLLVASTLAWTMGILHLVGLGFGFFLGLVFFIGKGAETLQFISGILSCLIGYGIRKRHKLIAKLAVVLFTFLLINAFVTATLKDFPNPLFILEVLVAVSVLALLIINWKHLT